MWEARAQGREAGGKGGGGVRRNDFLNEWEEEEGDKQIKSY